MDEELVVVCGKRASSKNKRAVYEPSGTQRCRKVICSKEMALTVGIVVCAVILAVAFIASFARPETPDCYTQDKEPSSDSPLETNISKPQMISHKGKLFPWEKIRLPRTILPLAYNIFLHPNLTTTLVTGNVTITCRAVLTTNFIVLHSDTLNTTEIIVHSYFSSEIIGIKEVLFYHRYALMYIRLDRFLEREELFDVRIYFRSRLLETLQGFYLSSYTAEDESTRFLATTNFEASGARKAFPCFDEPDMKANFTLSMVREERHISLFNMPLGSSSSYIHGLTLDSFDTTVKMSTYLVAFVVCDFANLTKNSTSGIQIRVFAPKENIHMTNLALDNAVAILDYYEHFFGLPYPLPKLDMIAIPDFDASAMENWGLVTFQTNYLLYDPLQSTVRNKFTVASTVAHELAHQWFGNLVTLEWWNDLWLHEGFAEFIEYIGVNVLNSNYHVFQLFVSNILLSGLKADSMLTSHPIEMKVTKPEDIDSIFDRISYYKGSSIIRMMRHFLGPDVFERRLNNYLTKYAYSNARTDDLWESMSQSPEGAQLNVKAIMDTWTKQMGYPLVSIEIRGDIVTAKQERFFLSPLVNKSIQTPSPFNYKWYIPVTYVTSTEPSVPNTVWLNMTSVTFTIPEGTLWVKANYKSYGFYRVNYEDTVWKSLISELTTNHEVFQPEDRATLIDDLCSMARSGKVDYNLCLDATEYLVQEEEYVAFSTGLMNLMDLKQYMANMPEYEYYKNYILKLLSNQIKILGWKNEGPPLKKMLRTTVLSTAIIMGDRDTLNKGKELFKQWRFSNKSINPELLRTVIMAGIADGSPEVWDYLWQTYTECNSPLFKKQLLGIMGETPNGNDLFRYLAYTMQKDYIRNQDLHLVYSSIASTPAGSVLAWRHLKLNWKELDERLRGTMGLSSLVRSIIISFATDMEYQQVIDFFANKNLGRSQRFLDNTMEGIRMNVNWMDNHSIHVAKWFRQHGQ